MFKKLLRLKIVSFLIVFGYGCVAMLVYAGVPAHMTPVAQTESTIKAPMSNMTLLHSPLPAPTQSAPLTAAVVGKVVWVKGGFVAIGADSKQRTLNKADPIFLHDTLETDANTEAQIVFTDDTLMTFRPITKFYIDTYTYDSSKASNKGSVGKYVMNLVEGGFRTITGVIAKSNPTDYRVNTPVATIGVRGTDYAVFLQNGALFVGFYQGAPCVTGGSQTMCLDKKTPFAKVPSAHMAPIPLVQQPAVFQHQAPITNVKYIAVGGVIGTGGSNLPPGPTNNVIGTTPSSGDGSTITTTPVNPNDQTINATTTGILNSFCIQ